MKDTQHFQIQVVTTELGNGLARNKAGYCKITQHVQIQVVTTELGNGLARNKAGCCKMYHQDPKEISLKRK